jgi:hypothetical protein
MKKQISVVILLAAWIFVTSAYGAQAQPSGDYSARVFNSTDISVPQLNVGEWKTLTFDSERWDTANLHDTATNTSRLKAPVAGKYYIFANITWETPLGSGFWGLRIVVNGKTAISEQTLPNNGASFRTSMSIGTMYALNAGDYVEVQVFQNSGGFIAVKQITATSPEFGMARVP